MHKKSVRWTAALCAAGLMLAGCGPVAGDSGTEKIRLMVWSPSEDQSKDSGQWLQTCCENFAALHPEWDITFVYGVADEASAAGAVAQDPEASADVFMYANDTLTTMTDANALAKFGGIYAEELKATNSETLLDSLTLDGNIYGVPFTTNTWYMYYDKSVFTEEDVKSLDAMLEKGVVRLPLRELLVPAGVLLRQRLHPLRGRHPGGTGRRLRRREGRGSDRVSGGPGGQPQLQNRSGRFRAGGIAGRQHQRHLLRFLGCGGGTGDSGRRYRRGGPAHLHPERGGKADVRLRRVQGHRRKHRHQVYESLGGAGYNALRMLAELAATLELDGRDYAALADRVRESFRAAFWREEAGCLRDVISGTGQDEQIRCNQIWAVAQPFPLLNPGQEVRVVATVQRELYTPVGLRTLAPGDTAFHPVYGGPQKERDLAYHQGTVWPFPLGAFYLAYLKVNGHSAAARRQVTDWLTALEPALREGCVGQLPEIYDGENPTASRGCFAQAWSVGELLRVYEALERSVPDFFDHK